MRNASTKYEFRPGTEKTKILVSASSVANLAPVVENTLYQTSTNGRETFTFHLEKQSVRFPMM